MSLLTPEIKAAVGRTLPPVKAEVTRREIRKYAVAAGHRLAKYVNGDEAPPLFLFGLFLEIADRDRMLPDGRQPGSGLVPELPLPRVMAGGTQATYHRGIYPGDVLVSKQTFVDLFEKQGSQGPLIFAVVENRVETEAGEPVMTERATPNREINIMPDLNAIQVGDALPERIHQPDTVQLFMYNAAIWNPHRIHYDYPYTTQVERHPDIVVDGPLQGDWLTQVVLEWIKDDAILIEFQYTNRKAAYVNEKLRAVGTVADVDPAAGEVRVDLGILNERGDVISPGAATVRFNAAQTQPVNARPVGWRLLG